MNKPSSPLRSTGVPPVAADTTGALCYVRRVEEYMTEQNDKCASDFRFHMAVTRIYEDPRVTKPYTENQWEEIDDLGRDIDDELRSLDVRLTMGGEPTFVSIDDRDGPEWNILAHGPLKRRLAGVLLHRLHKHRAGRVAALRSGQVVSRRVAAAWALACYWRRDGESIWEEPDLVADQERSPGHGPVEAGRFIATLATTLGVDASFCLPAYEDVWYYLWKEHCLPEMSIR